MVINRHSVVSPERNSRSDDIDIMIGCLPDWDRRDWMEDW